MNYCHVSAQADAYCNQHEDICPDCGDEMFFDEDRKEVLTCQSCDREIDTQPDY